MSAPVRRDALYLCAVQAHVVGERWRIPAWECVIGADDEVDARCEASRLVAARVRLPPWKPLRREVYRNTSARLADAGKPRRARPVRRAPRERLKAAA